MFIGDHGRSIRQTAPPLQEPKSLRLKHDTHYSTDLFRRFPIDFVRLQMMHSIQRTAWLATLAFALLSCTDDGTSDESTTGTGAACRGGSNVHVGSDGQCYCDNGYDWCDISDPSNYNCCAISGGGGGGRGGGGDTRSACETNGSHSACSSNQFCHNRECTDVFGRSWRITIVSAAVATTKPDGSAWDFGGGAPDLLACFDTTFSGDNYAGCTGVVQDQFSATWNWSTTFVMQSGGLVLVDLFDEDLSAEDHILSVLEEGNDALVDLARNAGTPTRWSDGLGNEIILRFDPGF